MLVGRPPFETSCLRVSVCCCENWHIDFQSIALAALKINIFLFCVNVLRAKGYNSFLCIYDNNASNSLLKGFSISVSY